MSPTHDKPATPFPPEPAWEIARLFPDQGAWSEEEYLALNPNRLVEFSHGHVEVLPMPTTSHQLIVLFMYRLLQNFVTDRQLGMVLVAPLRVQLWPGKYREPNLVFMKVEHADRVGESFWQGADLVMEVVSDEYRRHDLETKRREYAQARISEYWIIDPAAGQVTVLRLDGEAPRYLEHGTFARGGRAASALLPGFVVDVTAALTAES